MRVVKGATGEDVQSIEIWDRVMGLVSCFNLKVCVTTSLHYLNSSDSEASVFRKLMFTAEFTLTRSLAPCSYPRIRKVSTTSQRRRRKRMYPSYHRLH